MSANLERGDRLAAGAVAFTTCKEPATVLGSVTTLDGEVRYVVQCDAHALHIYSPEQVGVGGVMDHSRHQ